VKRYFIGGFVAVGLLVTLGAGIIPPGNNGGFMQLFSPKSFETRESTKSSVHLNVSGFSAIKVTPSEAASVFLNMTAVGTPKALAADTEYTFGIYPGIAHMTFTHASSATPTSYFFEEQ